MITRRHYEPDTDLERLIAVLVEAWTPSGPQSIWHIGDVSWWVRQAWDTVPFVWEDDTGQLVGFADYDRQGEFELLVAPRHLGGAIHQQMLAEMEEELCSIAAADGTAWALLTFATEDNLPSLRLLERSGYRPNPDRKRHMFRSLAGPIEEPALPGGFRLRHFAGQEEIEAAVSIWMTNDRGRAVGRG